MSTNNYGGYLDEHFWECFDCGSNIPDSLAYPICNLEYESEGHICEQCLKEYHEETQDGSR